MPLIPRKYTAEVSLPPKRLMRKLDGDMTEYMPTINVLSSGKFMRQHKGESIYYGRCKADGFNMFYHRAKRRDGGSSGFYGKVEKSGKGSVITGWFRKPVYVYVVSLLWTAFFLLSAGGAHGAKDDKTAYFILAVGVIGLGVMLYDDSTRYIRLYLDGLKRPESRKEDSDA